MEKEKFTKEEYIKAKQVLESFQKQATGYSFSEWIDLQLKPETKFINVRIEYDAGKITFGMNDHAIRSILNCGCSDDKANWKVKELPEVWSDADMIEFAKFYMNHQHLVGHIMDNFKDERKSK